MNDVPIQEPIQYRVAGQDLVTGETVSRPPETRPTSDTIDNIRMWLAAAARTTPSLTRIVDEMAWRLLAAGLPVMRVTLSISTLHPQFLGASYVWWLPTAQTVEVMIGHEVGERIPYAENPVLRVRDGGETIRRRIDVADDRLDFPVLHDLKARGATDLLALPIPSGQGRWNYLAYVTGRAGGFTDDEVAQLSSMAEPLAIATDWHSQRQIAANVLNAYLGPKTGPKVLSGQIRRGSGEEIAAVLWSSDLRGFTAFSDHVPGAQVIEVLDTLFDEQAKAIESHGGEILKFIGDGLLAIFPAEGEGGAARAAVNALAAASQAQAAVGKLADAAREASQPALPMVVALHYGTVLYGNIGAARRLDFTVIGPAVNLVSRVETVAKTLNRPILVSDDFARVYGKPLRSLGFHPLRGLNKPHELFAPDGSADG
jgi:adenylate cyclase